MKHPQNIKDLYRLPIDMMGMIFYSKSPRYVEDFDYKQISTNTQAIQRVGVFVNEAFEVVQSKIKNYNLDLVQLHGKESYEYCLQFQNLVPVIKAFSISDISDIEVANNFGIFEGYYLFDTKTSTHGGSGKKFDWSILEYYKGNMPFFLSGGISSADIEDIKQIMHPQFIGIDLNSKFETKPGCKDIDLLKKFIKDIR